MEVHRLNLSDVVLLGATSQGHPRLAQKAVVGGREVRSGTNGASAALSHRQTFLMASLRQAYLPTYGAPGVHPTPPATPPRSSSPGP